jgi:hypothetical protein
MGKLYLNSTKIHVKGIPFYMLTVTISHRGQHAAYLITRMNRLHPQNVKRLTEAMS